MRRIDASLEFKHQCLLFLCTRRVLNYLLQKPFFPLHRRAACRLHLFDNQPPARWLRHSLTPTRAKCMWTDSQNEHGRLETTTAEISGKLQENTRTSGSYRSFYITANGGGEFIYYLTHCVDMLHSVTEKDRVWTDLLTSWLQSVHLSAGNTTVNEPKRY